MINKLNKNEKNYKLNSKININSAHTVVCLTNFRKLEINILLKYFYRIDFSNKFELFKYLLRKKSN